jgi:hypothetical protein
VLSTEARRYPSIGAIRAGFGTDIDIRAVPIPLDCRDGFNEAYYGRPEMRLEDGARLSCSAWSFVTPEVAAGYIEHLRREIADGSWDRKYGALRRQPSFEGSLYLVVSRG